MKIREVIELLEHMEKNGYTEVKADMNTIDNVPIVYETDHYCLEQHLKCSLYKPKKV